MTHAFGAKKRLPTLKVLFRLHTEPCSFQKSTTFATGGLYRAHITLREAGQSICLPCTLHACVPSNSILPHPAQRLGRTRRLLANPQMKNVPWVCLTSDFAGRWLAADGVKCTHHLGLQLGFLDSSAISAGTCRASPALPQTPSLWLPG